MDLPTYDELHVISDLHMGGDRPEFQILRETTRLAGYIRWVGAQRPDGRVALVLNGDVVDTLAEEIGGYVAAENAVTTLERIMRDAAFDPVWSALSDFTKTPNRTLVIVIGNHDIELALPPVQRLVLARLAGETAVARTRIEFATVGAGYTCMVGNARVFCTHGNEVDPWNYVRYEDLSRLSRRLNTGRALAPSEWEPNAGTRMVKDVMNEVKRRYAWIDLLKPETQAAVGVLLVLDPSKVGKITLLPPLVGKPIGRTSEGKDRLSAEGFTSTRSETAAPAPVPVDQLFGADLARGLKLGVSRAHTPDDRLAEEMLLMAELNYHTPRARSMGEDETLGLPQLLHDEASGLPRLAHDRLLGWMTGVGKDEALRRALLDWLADDKTFDIAYRDATFKDIEKSVGSAIDFIVTGHTHLHRAIDIGDGRYYFNSGTWIRLLRFTPAMLKDVASFKSAYDVLADGRLSTIDAAILDGEPFVVNRSSAVLIKAASGRVAGSLGRVEGTDSIVWNEIQRFVRP